MSDDHPDRAKWLGLIAKSDAAIARAAELGADTGADEQIAKAHYLRALALAELDRDEESCEDWDAFLRAWTQLHPAPRDRARLLLVQALTNKRATLEALGRNGDALALDAEVAERFAADADAEIRPYVAVALARHASGSLRDPEALDTGLELSGQLLARLGSEPEESLEPLVQVLLAHARELHAGHLSPSLPSYAGLVAETAFNAAVHAAGALTTIVESRLEIPQISSVRSGVRHLTPGPVLRSRRRRTQAVRVSRAVAQRLAGSDDPRLLTLARHGQLLAALIGISLGHIREGARAATALIDSRDPAVVAALSDLAAAEGKEPGWLQQLGVAALLSARADALVGEEPRLARIAFDDSVEKYLPEDARPVMRWLVRRFRPSG